MSYHITPQNAATTVINMPPLAAAQQQHQQGVVQPTPTGATVAEDAANDTGEAIDTFSGYAPTALPMNVLKILQERKNTAAKPMSTTVASLSSNNSGSNNKDDNEKNDDNDNHSSSSSSTSSLSFESLQIPSHTSPSCESALLSSVTAPRATNDSADCLLNLVECGALSPLQMEGCTLAIQRHTRLLYHEESGRTRRAGFFIGDAAGIGKGRQIAAILRDSLCRGRPRHLWVSVSRELSLDAQRDLQAVQCYNTTVHDGTDFLQKQTRTTSSSLAGLGTSSTSENSNGILFITYSLLVSGQGRRMEDIIKWLTTGSTATTTTSSTTTPVTAEQSFDGVLVFDEAHKAKNLEADTYTAKLVVEIQNRLPNARVLYCSATGVSDIQHMVYANRLGLWGYGSTLYPTFDSFRHIVSNRGVGSLELLALEMKQMGIFVARTLSWDGAEFHTLQVALDTPQKIMYDGAVSWWMMLQKEIVAALQILELSKSPPKQLWRSYWAAHQRFFREMAICCKVPKVVEESLHYLKNENCQVIIGLQSTGEANTQTALEELGQQILVDSGNSDKNNKNGTTSSSTTSVDYEDILLPSLVSTARSIMTSFVRNHFPIAPPPEQPPKIPPRPPNGFPDQASRLEYMRFEAEAERIKAMPPPPPIHHLVQRQQAMIDAAQKLNLPPNPLDDLIFRLGGETQVAELTGRSGRILKYDTATKKKQDQEQYFHYVRRVQESSNNSKTFGLSIPKSSEDCDKLNIVEKKKFMDGRKSVAIISDAASTGISLHAAAGSGAAHKRRVHFTIELPWAADKAIQQLGRSHRSGQHSAPIYKMVVTELGGERRFGAAVSKRMANLGALTKGDRRAATGSDLSEFDIDSIYGRRALAQVYQALNFGSEGQVPSKAPSRNGAAILDDYVKQAMVTNSLLSGKLTNEASQHIFALLVARQALEDVGLVSNDSNSSKNNSQVKVFLNRIAGLPVDQQKLVFALFMSTLDDVIAGAKATGEFEGSVEDVKATNIEMDGKPELLAVDKRSGASTMLTRLNLDRGISLESVVTQSLEDVNAEEKENDSKRAKSGWYVSKRTIAGRQLVLYAKRKVQADAETDESALDPLGLMIITRPNTGKNPFEMSSRDLKHKYTLVLSSRRFSKHLKEPEDPDKIKKEMLEKQVSDLPIDEIKEKLDSKNVDVANLETKSELVQALVNSRLTEFETADTLKSESNPNPLERFRVKAPHASRLWDDAYRDSDRFDHYLGLAPRRTRLGLVTGAVLHVLPALEKAVIMRKQAERALRVARVEISETGDRIVGIRFPLDNEVMSKLKEILQNLSQARKGSGKGTLFRDEGYTTVCDKSTARATRERKTMRSFFATASTPSQKQEISRPKLSGSKRKEMIPPATSTNDVTVIDLCDDVEVLSPAKTAKPEVVSVEKPLGNPRSSKMAKVNGINVKRSKTTKKSASIKSFFMKK